MFEIFFCRATCLRKKNAFILSQSDMFEKEEMQIFVRKATSLEKRRCIVPSQGDMFDKRKMLARFGNSDFVMR